MEKYSIVVNGSLLLLDMSRIISIFFFILSHLSEYH